MPWATSTGRVKEKNKQTNKHKSDQGGEEGGEKKERHNIVFKLIMKNLTEITQIYTQNLWQGSFLFRGTLDWNEPD